MNAAAGSGNDLQEIAADRFAVIEERPELHDHRMASAGTTHSSALRSVASSASCSITCDSAITVRMSSGTIESSA